MALVVSQSITPAASLVLLTSASCLSVMASRRLLSSLIRSSLRRSAPKSSITSSSSRFSSPSVSSRSSPYGYILNRVAEYATSAAATVAAPPAPSKKNLMVVGKSPMSSLAKVRSGKCARSLVPSSMLDSMKVCLRS